MANIDITDYEYDSSERSYNNSPLVQMIRDRSSDTSVLDKYEKN